MPIGRDRVAWAAPRELYRLGDSFWRDRAHSHRVGRYSGAIEPETPARFQREAKVLASLNHPNIASIYGLGESGDTRALVLELVDGPTLAHRIVQDAIPLDEALPIARQIAEALEAAHEQGVIHRDLKPANVKVKADGMVKVLGFGLAKALEPEVGGDPSQSPTMTAAATRMGVIMGTAAYMSPEQARGKVGDKRGGIWAFGVVLHEMLAGRRVFEGDDVSLTLAKVLDREPTWEALPENMPPKLDTRCLTNAKNTRRSVSRYGIIWRIGPPVRWGASRETFRRFRSSGRPRSSTPTRTSRHGYPKPVSRRWPGPLRRSSMKRTSWTDPSCSRPVGREHKWSPIVSSPSRARR